MSAKTEKLLSLYRTYENLVRDAGEDPKSLEASMDGVLASEMTLIRQFRNFLAHTEAPGFLEPTDKMLRVLEAQVDAWTMKGDVAKKHCRPPASSMCADSDTCADVVAKLAKLKRDRIACAHKDGTYGVYSVYAIAAAAVESKRTRMKDLKPLSGKPLFAAPSTPVREIDWDRTVICTSDGSWTGKLVGAVLLRDS